MFHLNLSQLVSDLNHYDNLQWANYTRIMCGSRQDSMILLIKCFFVKDFASTYLHRHNDVTNTRPSLCTAQPLGHRLILTGFYFLEYRWTSDWFHCTKFS